MPSNQVTFFRTLAGILCAVIVSGTALAAEPPAAKASQKKDPFRDLYRGYVPPFMPALGGGGWTRSGAEMRLSTEAAFFTLAMIHEDSRANALVEAGIDREQKGMYREALKIYQQVIDQFPQVMFRVSDYGVFVPVSQYCQRRILNFPAGDLAHYRTVHDPRARELFQQSRRRHSLIGFSEIIDEMLATSYGGQAIMELGNAALDTGHYLAALERYQTIAEFFPPPELRSREFELKIAYCQKMLGEKPTAADSEALPSTLSPEQVQKLSRLVASARPNEKTFDSQLTSAPNIDAADYRLYPPTRDPLAVKPPTWSFELPNSRSDFYVYTVPTVTRESLIYRHKNIVYSHSLLNGELRWVCDLGGRASWQWRLNYNHEDVLVQDGLVFTAMNKGGPSLVALDEVTGQLRWAYGPMVASTEEQAKMRFETAPAGGPMAVFSGYVLNNIEGDTHTDSEYGVMAFESTTGRMLWRTPISRLAPGKFAAGFVTRIRNRIRSFTSPPTYHQGTVYYTTNAGAVVALDALSGRIKWLFRYPYYHHHPHSIHDATRGFGSDAHYWYRNLPPSPMLWYNQRPLVLGEEVYFTPVNSPFLMCVNRRNGRVLWSHYKASGGVGYFMGPNHKGELVLVYANRRDASAPAILLLDPKTGRALNMNWDARARRSFATSLIDFIRLETRPALVNIGYGIMFRLHHTKNATLADLGVNVLPYSIGARPFMTQDNQLYVCNFVDLAYPFYGNRHLIAHIDLNERKVVQHADYYSGELLASATNTIQTAGPAEIKALEDSKSKDPGTLLRLGWLKKVCGDEVPTNSFKPFMSTSRITFERHGVLFELRFGTRQVEMLYDRRAVEAELAKSQSPEADFARAELALADARWEDAVKLLQKCLQTISSEDLDFRALIRQLLYSVHKRLAGSAIRAARTELELEHALSMSRTGSTLSDEIETLFALSDAYARRSDFEAAARSLRSLISTYGHREYAVAPIVVGDSAPARQTAHRVLDVAADYADNPFHGAEMVAGVELVRKGLPLYFSAVSPLPRPLTIPAGDLASLQLHRLAGQSPEFAAAFEKLAQARLLNGTPEEQFYYLPQFPGTQAAQTTLNRLFDHADKMPDHDRARVQRWRLADAARVAGLEIPEKIRPAILAPPPITAFAPATLPQKPQTVDLADEEGINWLVLERRGQTDQQPNLLFVGGRVRKRLDNKFVLVCFDLDKDGTQPRWRLDNIRLRGTGQEPGFFDAFLYKDLVVVNGLYDVIAYEHATGKERWRYRVPFDFEIRHALISGDLLVLTDAKETVALHLGSTAANGDVAWQQGELGDLYGEPYLVADRFVTVRRNPYNVTVRYRSTGRLMGRLELPDLSNVTGHPLIDNGPQALALAHDGHKLAVTNGWYYIMVDVERMAIDWKRGIDNRDPARAPVMRFALSGDYLVVVKEDYDVKTIWMLSSHTGAVRWRTDPKDAHTPLPMYSKFIEGDRLYGIGMYPGQGFYFVCRDCKTGKTIYQTEVSGYSSKPEVTLVPRNHRGQAVVLVKDRQDFEINLFDLQDGKRLHTLQGKGVGQFGVHGNVSATIQNGRVILMTGDKLNL